MSQNNVQDDMNKSRMIEKKVGFLLKFGYSEKATKFEEIFHVKFDVTEYRQILSGRFFQFLWPSQNIRTLLLLCMS